MKAKFNNPKKYSITLDNDMTVKCSYKDVIVKFLFQIGPADRRDLV